MTMIMIATMSDLFLYTIKSAFVLALLYVPYTLLLRKEDFFRFNRITLLGILVLTLMLPLCNVSSLSLDAQPVVHTAQRTMIEIGIPIAQMMDDEAVEPVVQKSSVSWFDMISYAYLLGMLVVFAVRVLQFARMGLVIRGGSLWRQQEDGVTIYCHADNVAPFSWLNNIVISKEDYDNNGREIILHEKGHIRCIHSADIIVLTFVQMLQWWNPLAYMLGISLRDVHEYEADNYVLCQGITLRDYQNLLIKKAVGSSSYTFANNFNHSLIKKRITMMCKKNSNPWMRSKVLVAIPLVAIALSAFATPEFVTPIEKAVQKVAPSHEAPAEVVGKGTNISMNDQAFDEENLSETAIADTTDVLAETGIDLRGFDESKGIILLDGKEVTRKEQEQIDVETIDHVNIFKGAAAKSVSGRDDIDGVVVVETKEYVESKKEGVFEVCEQVAAFEGGISKLMEFLGQNLHYPKVAEKCGAEGRVIVQFIVEKNGSISGQKVVANTYKAEYVSDEEGKRQNEEAVNTSGQNGKAHVQTESEYNEAKQALEKEAMRAVGLTSGKWVAAQQKGKKVRMKYNLPVTFRLR